MTIPPTAQTTIIITTAAGITATPMAAATVVAIAVAGMAGIESGLIKLKNWDAALFITTQDFYWLKS
jgi:hypothetical protein